MAKQFDHKVNTKNLKFYRFILFAVLIAPIIIGASLFHHFASLSSNKNSKNVFIADLSFHEARQEYDLDGDKEPEILQLKNRKLVVWHKGVEIFQSQAGYEVNKFITGDINNDGQVELVFGFWRYGDFGKKLDYQSLRRDPEKSYHLYLYQYSNDTNEFKLIWGSSTLPHPIYDFEVVRKDGQNVLKVVEGSYEDYDEMGKIVPVKTSLWVWNDWWFEEYDNSSSLTL